MKRAILVLSAISAGFVIGCGGSSAPPSQPSAAEGQQNGMSVGKIAAQSPELKLLALKTPKEKAEFFNKLGSDPTFDPKMHKSMLESYSKDKDPAVAEAAKELLDKAN